MSIYNLDRGKIRPEHRERAAYVYVRQSSPKQVREHQESRRRQYAFAEQARALGWSDAQVVTLDDDQGRSGTIPKTRAGFGQLVAAVARGEVGIVMSLELSRLSRNDPDWHHLVHLCRWTGTLIADEHGLYDPTSGPDRMVLGIRGHVSELERDNSVHRMVEARWNKARRGEMLSVVPAGYEVDETAHVGLTSDEAVADAIRRVFAKFDELGSARQVFVWWQREGLPFPVRPPGAGPDRSSGPRSATGRSSRRCTIPSTRARTCSVEPRRVASSTRTTRTASGSGTAGARAIGGRC
jgi:DNA invertase Pin-like site-specific DNA recombinase